MNRAPLYVRFGVLLAVSLAVGWWPLLHTFRLAAQNESYTHILMILPLSAVLVSLEWKTVRDLVQPSPSAGAVLFLLAIAAGCFAYFGSRVLTEDERIAVGTLAVVVWWIASFVFCFGQRAGRELMFPLCFLFLLVPVPEVAVSEIIRWLQHGSAWMAALLFRAVGEPVQRDGILLSLRDMDIEVAEQCSSIRSSMFLVVTTMFVAQLLLRSWWRKALLIAAAVPLSVAKNGLRIMVIGELGTRVDPGFLSGRLHHHGGILFFAVSVAAVAVLLWVLQRSETPALGQLQDLSVR